MEEKSTNQGEGVIGGRIVKKPIFIRFFWAFLSSSILTAGAMVYILSLAFRDLKGTSSEVSITLKEIIGDQALLIILFVFIPAIVFSVLNSQNVGNPIRKISQSIKEIAKGNLNIKLETKRKDELGNLMELFNEMTEKLKEVRKKGEEVSRLKSTFIGVASHQLRTPSTGITWGLQELLAPDGDPLTEKQKELLEQCQARNMEAIRIVDELMTVVQIEEEEYGYLFQELKIGDLITKLLPEYEIQASMNRMKIVLDNKIKDSTEVEGDPEKLSIVFRNLVQNSLQYGNKGTEIEIKIKELEGKAVISIADYGVGISPEDLDKVFVKFFRADSAIRAKPNGSGAGLYICKQIVEHHKGSIRAESNITDGKTTFTVELPIRAETTPQRKDMEDLFKTM